MTSISTSTFIPRQAPRVMVADEVVNFDPFFPNVSLSAYRAEYKADDMVTDVRLKENIETAIIFINDSLRQLRSGGLRLSDTQAHLYLRAVYHRTKIYIYEQSKDIDVTGHGGKTAESYLSKIRQEQQREREAIRLLIGRTRVTVSLV